MRQKTPTIIQLEQAECGAVSLAILMGFFGKFKPLEELRVACGISRNGSVASNLIKAARDYGFEAKGYSYSLEELKALSHPFIVYWQNYHFLVVEGFKGEKVFLNDPARGHRIISLEEFSKSYSNVALVIKPTEGFKSEGEAPNFIKLLRPYLAGFGQPFFYLIVLYLLFLIPTLALPIFAGFFLDEIFMKEALPNLFLLFTAMGVAIAITLGIKILEGFFLTQLNGKLSLRLSSRLIWHLLHLPIDFFFQRQNLELISRVTLSDSIISISQKVLRAFMQLIHLVLYAVLLFLYHPLVGVLGLLLGALNILAIRTLNQKRSEETQVYESKKIESSAYSLGGIQNSEVIKELGVEEDFFAHWAGYYAEMINAKQRVDKKEIFLWTLPIFFQITALLFLFFWGGREIQEGRLTAGELFSLQIIMALFLFPITHLLLLTPQIRKLKGQLLRVEDAFAAPLFSSNLERSGQKGEIKIENLTFGHSKIAPPMLKHFSLYLPPGKIMALKGEERSGKSTLVRLISGLYQPWSGSLKISQNVAVIDSDPFLIEGSIRDNIFFWNPKISDQQMIRAAEDAALHPVIINRHGGYESLVAEGGKNFSRGERVRIGMARALCRSPDCVILDGALDLLDVETVSFIFQNLRLRGCSSLIITNREETLAACDLIYELKQEGA